MDWKTTAEQLYFKNEYTMTEISRKVGVSVAAISKHLNSIPKYKSVSLQRKMKNQDRTEYYRNYKRKQRANFNIDNVGYSSKRMHEIAVSILNRERYFDE